MRHVIIGGNGFLGRELARQAAATGEPVLVVDLAPSLAPELSALQADIAYVECDIAEADRLADLQLRAGDAVHHLASKLLIPNHPRTDRDGYYARTNVHGTRHLVEKVIRSGGDRMVFWSTDMVYGPALHTPRREDHPRQPFGPYGRSKVLAEDYLFDMRLRGFRTTILRPRLIMGPGRLGIFSTLFRLIDLNLPVPLIGDGRNRFQFISVRDCARASLAAVASGFPDTEINLGSAAPPTEHELLRGLIRAAGSGSPVLRTPAPLVKATLRALHRLGVAPMDPEQYEIADLEVTLDITRAGEVLGWAPLDDDQQMLIEAYRAYRAAKDQDTRA